MALTLTYNNLFQPNTVLMEIRGLPGTFTNKIGRVLASADETAFTAYWGVKIETKAAGDACAVVTGTPLT